MSRHNPLSCKTPLEREKTPPAGRSTPDLRALAWGGSPHTTALLWMLSVVATCTQRHPIVQTVL